MNYTHLSVRHTETETEGEVRELRIILCNWGLEFWIWREWRSNIH